MQISLIDKINKPIFLVGCDRSGTTLLSILLDKSPDLAMTLESGFIPDLYNRRKEYGKFNSSKQRWFFIRDLQFTHATSRTIAFDIFELNDEEAETALAEVAPTDYPGAINALFSRAAQKKGKKRWGNKTPRYVMELKLLSDLFPNSKIVHIIRDPRDVANSIHRAGWTSTIREAAQMWKKRVSKGLEGRKYGKERYYELKYEDLVQQPHKELKNLYHWLDITFDQYNFELTDNDAGKIQEEHKELHRLIGKPIDPSRAYSWKKNISRADIAEIEEVTHDLTAKLDYELTGYHVPLHRKLVRTTYDLLLSIGKDTIEKMQNWL